MLDCISKFCAKHWCKNCLLKKRPISGKPGERFDICDTCVDKFAMKQLHDQYFQQYKERANSTQQIVQQYQQLKTEYLALRGKYNQSKRDVRGPTHTSNS